jgi:hypothetical protein
VKIYIKSSIASNPEYYEDSITGIAYKVFRVKNGKLYPPKVDNPGGVDTPIGIWLEADVGELSDETTKSGDPKVKSSDGSSLAFRPGWHLGDLPEANQFNKQLNWKIVNKLPKDAIVTHRAESEKTLPKACKVSDIGCYVRIGKTDKYAYVTGTSGRPFLYFPYNFIWAKCMYVMNVDYQEEAHQHGLGTRKVNYKLLPDTVDTKGATYHILEFQQGKNIFNVTFSDSSDIHIDGYPFENLMSIYNSKDYVQKEVQNYFLEDNIAMIRSIIESNSKRGRETMLVFAHINGDLEHLPTDGYYRYRTNPSPDTVPWVITGAMKVLELLDDKEINAVLRKHGMAPMVRQGGNLTAEEIIDKY